MKSRTLYINDKRATEDVKIGTSQLSTTLNINFENFAWQIYKIRTSNYKNYNG